MEVLWYVVVFGLAVWAVWPDAVGRRRSKKIIYFVVDVLSDESIEVIDVFDNLIDAEHLRNKMDKLDPFSTYEVWADSGKGGKR